MNRSHTAYCALVRSMRCDPAMIHLRGVRFFDAAALVTGASGLGIMEPTGGVASWLIDLYGLRDAVLRLAAISAWLLAANLEVLDSLAQWRELRSPLSPDGPSVSAAAFDEAMVVFEQRAVDDYLRRHPLEAAQRRGIDRLLALCACPGLGRVFGVDDALCRAVRRRSIGRKASFFDIDTRVAIGLDLVRELRASPADQLERTTINARARSTT